MCEAVARDEPGKERERTKCGGTGFKDHSGVAISCESGEGRTADIVSKRWEAISGRVVSLQSLVEKQVVGVGGGCRKKKHKL